MYNMNQPNPYFKPKKFTNFGFQPIGMFEVDFFRGDLHDSFNVDNFGNVFNGHTTIRFRGGFEKRLPW